MTAYHCNAGSPNVRVGDTEPASYTCQLAAYHDGDHTNGSVTWRDPTEVFDEPKPWHPNHRPHGQT